MSQKKPKPKPKPKKQPKPPASAAPALDPAATHAILTTAMRVLQYRSFAGLTIRAASEAAGMKHPNWSAIETGRRVPSAAVLGRMAKALGVDVSKLLAPAPRVLTLVVAKLGALDGETHSDRKLMAEVLEAASPYSPIAPDKVLGKLISAAAMMRIKLVIRTDLGIVASE